MGWLIFGCKVFWTVTCILTMFFTGWIFAWLVDEKKGNKLTTLYLLLVSFVSILALSGVWIR